jgi:hypothetical protein
MPVSARDADVPQRLARLAVKGEHPEIACAYVERLLVGGGIRGIQRGVLRHQALPEQGAGRHVVRPRTTHRGREEAGSV